MSEYGVLSTGFSRKRLPEIKSSLENKISQRLGVDIAVNPDSVLGNIIGVFAEALDENWQLAEDTYNAMPPSKATDDGLTNSVAFTGVTRIAAESTKLYVTCLGISGTVLPIGSTIADVSENYYKTLLSQTISLSNATRLNLSLASVTTGYVYGVIIDGTSVSYTAVGGDTVATVLTQIASNMPTGFTATVTNGIISIVSDDLITGVAMSYGSYFTFVSCGSPIVFWAEETGALNPTIGTMSNIITVVAGWSSINNEVAAIVGRAAETDIELRQRYASVVANIGIAIIESIRANILELDSVTECIVFENDTDVTDSDGRPPHSIEVIVLGGDSTEIVSKIWDTKAPGITTYGSLSGTVTDSQMIDHTVYYNRPSEIDVYIKCTIHAQSGVELSSDIASLVETVILNNSFSIGDDVILQKIGAQVITNIEGLSYVEVEGSTNGSTYTTTNIAITARQIAIFDSARIDVVIGT